MVNTGFKRPYYLYFDFILGLCEVCPSRPGNNPATDQNRQKLAGPAFPTGHGISKRWVVKQNPTACSEIKVQVYPM